MAQKLAGVERVSVGLAEELPREPEPGLVELVAGRALHDLDDVGLGQAFKREPLDALLAVQVREHVGRADARGARSDSR